MSNLIDLTKQYRRCAYCHAVKTVKTMLFIKGKFYCSASCHNNHNHQKL